MPRRRKQSPAELLHFGPDANAPLDPLIRKSLARPFATLRAGLVVPG